MKEHSIVNIFTVILTGITFSLSAQVSISTDNFALDPSVMLDVKSTQKGILIPRMGTGERDLLPSPATGLLIYNTTTNLFNYYNGSFWYQAEASFISSATGGLAPGGGISINATPNTLPDNSAMLDVDDPSRGLLIPRTTTNLITTPASGLIIYNVSTNLFQYYDGYQWNELCSISTGAVGATGSQASIGTSINTDGSNPDPSAMMDIAATDKGVLIPRLTDAQRDQILPATGLAIFNISSNTIQFFNGSGWYSINLTYLTSPLPGTQVSSQTGIVWNWIAVPGAAGYKWNTANDPGTATDLGANTSWEETGLTCSTPYSRYIWAYNPCGVSVSTKLSQTTALCNPWNCGLPIIDARDAQSYTTVQVGNQCWFAENLNFGTTIPGSTEMSDNSIIEKYCYNNNEENCDVYGGLYKWDEVMQYSNTPGVQGICPDGWHVPTDVEYCTLSSFIDASVECGTGGFSGTDAGDKMKEAGTTHWDPPNAGATNESGFTGLPGGYNINDSYSFLGFMGHWWTSSTENGDHPLWMLETNHATVGRWVHPSTYGFSVRCINDCDHFPTQSNAGPDQLNIQGNSASLQGNTPVNGTGQWNIINGSGGQIANNTNPASTFIGSLGNSYTLRWSISTTCASSKDDVVISFWGCGQPISISHIAGDIAPVTKSVTYGTTTNIAGETSKCWITSNLGADHQATSVNDATEASAGWYWQFNLKQGYKHDGTNLTPNSIWISDINENSDWLASNDPCTLELGNGWRIPAGTEWTNVDASGNWTNWNGPWASALKLHAAGLIWYDGLLYYRGTFGNYWSSTQYNDGYGLSLNFYSGYCYVSGYPKSDGFTLRCLWECLEPTQSDAGPNQFNIIGTSALLEGNTPTSGTGLWIIVNGEGGNITEPTNPVSSFTGMEGNAYTLRWNISSECNTSSSEVVISFASADCGLPFTDTRNSKVYNTIKIGNQCWMKENLNIGTRIDGTSQQTDNSAMEKYCLGDNTNNCDVYGGLYQWGEAMQYSTTPGVKGLCPDGWHLPVYDDWVALYGFLGGYTVAGGKMKSTGTVEGGTGLWFAPNTDATNNSGFTALPANLRFPDGSFNIPGYDAYFWSSTEYNGTSSWYSDLYYNESAIYVPTEIKEYGFSIRCIKDTCPQPTQSNAGPDQLNIQGVFAWLQGNAPTSGSGQWSIISGTGGIIPEPSNPFSNFTGVSGNSYTLRWTISAACGTSEDDVMISFAPFTCSHSFLDTRNNLAYNSVQIGTQCWMRENLNIGTMINGAIGASNNGIIEKYCYMSDPNYCDVYGGLYQWNEMMGYSVSAGAQGICADGWHVPAHEEWCTLEQLLGQPPSYCNTSTFYTGGGDLKETGYNHWDPPNSGATNSTGFTALPGGWGSYGGGFSYIRDFAAFWTSSAENSNSYGPYWYRELYNTNAYIYHILGGTYDQYMSIRCINNCIPPTQSNAGPDQLNIQGITATLQGNTPVSGTGQWSIISGAGGTISEPPNPASSFNGVAGNSYTLRWTITAACASSVDDVVISFW